MNPTNLSIRFKDQFEKDRLSALAGENTVTDFVLGLAFNVERKHGTDEEYPGWEVVERGRRDRGIKIFHPKFKEAVVLYPEDDAYGQFDD